ncbi:MAG TPA: phosphotransferase [Myxococcales bacterium]|nr:phosphotransferase [Myxococcales bacterium]
MVLTADEQRNLTASLVRMKLAAEGEVPRLTPLTGGISSLIVRADTSRGTCCIKQALAQLRVAAEWKAPVERNLAEARYLKLASGVSPGAVPRLIAEDPEGAAFAMELFDERVYPNWKAQLRDGVIRPAVASGVARLMVSIHRATAGDAKVARDFANDDWFRALRLDPYFGAAAAMHPDCAPVLERLIEVTASTKRALVHGDASPKNVLAGPDGPVLLDAECAWFGDPAFDLSFALTHLLLKCIWKPAFSAGYLDCFDSLSRDYLRSVNWEPATDLEARAALCVAGLLLARIDGKSPVEYLTDEGDRARVRAFARKFLLQPAAALAPLREAWHKELCP